MIPYLRGDGTSRPMKSNWEQVLDDGATHIRDHIATHVCFEGVGNIGVKASIDCERARKGSIMAEILALGDLTGHWRPCVEQLSEQAFNASERAVKGRGGVCGSISKGRGRYIFM